MLLGDFIKELKHNSLKITITDGEETKFYGTLSVLKNYIYYQNNWCNCKIFNIEAYYQTNMATALEIEIYIKKEV